MKINRDVVHEKYLLEVSRLADLYEWKTQFLPVEIVGIICSIVFPVSTVNERKVLEIYSDRVVIDSPNGDIRKIVDSICDIIQERWGQL